MHDWRRRAGSAVIINNINMNLLSTQSLTQVQSYKSNQSSHYKELTVDSRLDTASNNNRFDISAG